MTKILKGDASKEITLALADGYDYAGATVEVRYQGERFLFRDCRAGGSVSFRFTAEQTAPMALGAFPVTVRVGRPDGSWATFDNARVRIEVTDDPGEVNEGGVIALDVRGGLFGLSGLPARWTDADVREKVNEIIRRLGGTAAALALCALPALGASSLSAPKAEILSDAPVVTNVTFEGLATTAEVTSALAAYAKRTEIPDIPTKVSALTNDAGYLTSESDPTVPAWAKAATKPAYTASEVGAYTKAQTDAAISSATDGLATKAETKTLGNRLDWMSLSVDGLGLDLAGHTNSTANPHKVTAAQAGAVPTARKVNGKALSSDVTLGAADVGAYTKAQTDAAISSALAAKADKSALSGYATTAALAAKADASALAAKQDRPAATATAAALSLRADGAAISVAVAASGTLSADLAGWTDGQAQTALISLAPGASVAAAVSLVGYGSWPTNRFVASCVRVGPRVYVTPITALAE